MFVLLIHLSIMVAGLGFLAKIESLFEESWQGHKLGVWC